MKKCSRNKRTIIQGRLKEKTMKVHQLHGRKRMEEGEMSENFEGTELTKRTSVRNTR